MFILHLMLQWFNCSSYQAKTRAEATYFKLTMLHTTVIFSIMCYKRQMTNFSRMQELVDTIEEPGGSLKEQQIWMSFTSRRKWQKTKTREAPPIYILGFQVWYCLSKYTKENTFVLAVKSFDWSPLWNTNSDKVRLYHHPQEVWTLANKLLASPI